jgi:hypothetical protein
MGNSNYDSAKHVIKLNSICDGTCLCRRLCAPLSDYPESASEILRPCEAVLPRRVLLPYVNSASWVPRGLCPLRISTELNPDPAEIMGPGQWLLHGGERACHRGGKKGLQRSSLQHVAVPE